MLDPDFLRRLSEGTQPSEDLKNRIQKRILKRIRPGYLLDTAHSVLPTADIQKHIKNTVNRRVSSPSAGALSTLAQTLSLSPDRRAALRESIAARLKPVRTVLVHTSLKWATACAVFLLIVRFVLPLALLAPRTEAETSVQIVPDSGTVSMLVGGVWATVDKGQEIKGPVTIKTGDFGATLYLHDDAVLRLAEHTTVRVHDLTDRPQVSIGPTVTLVSGDIWVLGLVPGVFTGISLETTKGTVELNEGSISLHQDSSHVSLSVYDRGAAFVVGTDNVYLAAGERLRIPGSEPLKSEKIPASVLTDTWAKTNLQLDSEYRQEVLKLQEARREKDAGILPTSYLYSMKRVAEEVDLLFTLDNDTKVQKRVDQAETRLNEAATLLKDGQTQEAAVPLLAYRQTLLDLATGSGGDNLVSYLINKQLADASASIATVTPDTKMYALKQAILDVSAEIPNTELKSQDVEGYVLVDKLMALSQSLSADKDVSKAISNYRDIQPYIANLMADTNDVPPLLKKEAQSLLVKTSSLLADLSKDKQAGTDTGAIVMKQDIDQYLPVEPAVQNEVLVSEEQLDAQVRAMVDRVLLFRSPVSRSNQIKVELDALRSNPNEGTLLRRFFHALPGGLQAQVHERIVQLSDELNRK